jgi:hypothetical protein
MLRSGKPKKELDPELWRPVSLPHDPDDFVYLIIDEMDEKELIGSVFRWPRVNVNGRIELTRHCTIRATPTGGMEFAFFGDSLIDRRSRSPFSKAPRLNCGEVVAVRTATNEFWDSAEDLVGWGHLSLPAVKITKEYQEVADARFEPVAWTLWRDWLGQAPLIAHVGRLASQLITAATDTPALVSFEARVAEDSEKFFSPDAYLERATPQALEKPDSVTVEAGDQRLWVKLTVARRRDREREWLKNAVLLEAGSSDPGSLDRVVGLHKRIVAAVRRGEPRWGADKSSTSVAGFRPLDREGKAQEIPGPWRARAERRASRVLIGVASFGGGVAAAVSELGWIGLLVAGGALGSFVGVVLAIWPGVEFTARRSERIGRFAAKGLIAPLVGAGGAVLFRVLAEGKGLL